MIPKNPPLRNPEWLKKVRDLPCVITGLHGPSDPAHIRHGLGGGMGMKPGDNYVLPLNHDLHRCQHDMGEVAFWRKFISHNPHFMMECLKAYARQLYRENNP